MIENADTPAWMPVHMPLQRLDREDPVASLHIPDGAQCAAVLYRVYDASRQALYIGQTSTVSTRLKAHRRDSKWWSLAEYIALSFYGAYGSAVEPERTALRNERPRFNTQSVRGPAYVRLPLHGDVRDAAELIHAQADPGFVAALAELLAAPGSFPRPAPPPPARLPGE